MWDLSHQIAKQQEKNNALKARNDTLDAEVRDLKSGRAAIEERARSELGMVKQDEVFYQVLEGPMPVITPPPTAPEAAKTDTPIVVKVPGKNPIATPGTKESGPKEKAPKDIPRDKSAQEKSSLEKSTLSPQAINPTQQTESTAPKKAEESTKAEENSKQEKPKKAKPAASDALDDAKAVLKQQ